MPELKIETNADEAPAAPESPPEARRPPAEVASKAPPAALLSEADRDQVLRIAENLVVSSTAASAGSRRHAIDTGPGADAKAKAAAYLAYRTVLSVNKVCKEGVD